MTKTTLATIVKTILTGAVIAKTPLAVDDGTERRGLAYDALADTQVVAENPTTVYAHGPASVGASAMIIGSEAEGNQDVIGQPKRTYIAFTPIPGTSAHETVDLAQLTFYAESGTAWSSKDSTICNRLLAVDVYALLMPLQEGYSVSLPDIERSTVSTIAELTWENRKNFSDRHNTHYAGQTMIQEPCSTTRDNPTAYTVDVTHAFQLNSIVYGFVLQANERGELSSTVLPTPEERWNAQTDVVIGTRETGNPATLRARYSTK